MITRHPCLAFGILGLIFYALECTLDLLYDESGWRGLLFWIGQVFQLPFWLMGELLSSFNGGTVMPYQTLIAFIMGFVICLAVDALIGLLLRWRKSKARVARELTGHDHGHHPEP